MKGAFFREGLEFRLVLDGQSWRQGERLRGTIQVRNHGSADVALGDLRVVLAEGRERKVKAKAVGAFSELESQTPLMGRSEVPAGRESVAAPFEFELGDRARVTDKSASLYVLYGRGADHAAFGHLQLKVLPRLEYEDFLDVLRDRFHCALKGVTAGKRGEVLAKLSPPEGNTFRNVEQLDVSLALTEGQYHAELEFTVKRVDPASPVLANKKELRMFERYFAQAEFLHSFNGRLNKDYVEAFVQEAVDQVLGESSL